VTLDRGQRPEGFFGRAGVPVLPQEPQAATAVVVDEHSQRSRKIDVEI